jgi:uncharacterized membrane protein (DUF2068 family)
MRQSALQQNSQRHTLRAIALFETFKGLAAIIVSLVLLSLANNNVRYFTYGLISYFHLDSNAHYFKTLFDYSDLLGNENLHLLVLMAWGYAAVRFIESYGLWKSHVWAEWLAALSGGIYLPIEVNYLMQHTNAINIAVLVINACVVVYMIYRLWWRRAVALNIGKTALSATID